MSINYGYLFTYGEDGKKLPAKRDLKRAIKQEHLFVSIV